jgi:hypothetical protein
MLHYHPVSGPNTHNVGLGRRGQQVGGSGRLQGGSERHDRQEQEQMGVDSGLARSTRPQVILEVCVIK